MLLMCCYVLKAMEEVGLPVDFIGGTSQGAFMAALYAQWCHTQALGERSDELCRGIGSVTGLLRDFTLPILSMFSGKSFSATVRNALGNTTTFPSIIFALPSHILVFSNCSVQHLIGTGDANVLLMCC